MSCNTSTSIAASDWFDASLNDILRSDDYKTCWPWANITQDEFVSMPSLLKVSLLQKIIQGGILVITPIGVIGSFLSIVAFWRLAVKEKEILYQWMLAVAALELAFNILYFPFVMSLGWLYDNQFQYTYFGTAVACILDGFVYGMSMATDLCTLALTVERFISFCKPTVKLEGKTRVIFNSVSAACITVGFALRFVTSLEYVPGESGPDDSGRVTYTFLLSTIQKTQWYSAISFMSDMISPFVLLTVMAYLSARIAYTVIKRNRSSVMDNLSAQEKQVMRQQSNAGLRLLYILVAMFSFCQVSYCLYAIGTAMRNGGNVEYDSGHEEVVQYADTVLYLWVFCVLNYIIESLSRSLNFYLYCYLSPTVREEFKRVFQKGSGWV